MGNKNKAKNNFCKIHIFCYDVIFAPCYLKRTDSTTTSYYTKDQHQRKFIELDSMILPTVNYLINQNLPGVYCNCEGLLRKILEKSEFDQDTCWQCDDQEGNLKKD